MSITMAAMSAAPTSTTTLTPPSSSHGNGYSWEAPSNGNPEDLARGDQKGSSHRDFENGLSRPPFLSQNGNSAALPSSHTFDASPRKAGAGDPHSNMKGLGYLSPPYGADLAKPGSIKETNSPADSLLDLYGPSQSRPSNDSNKRGVTEVVKSELDDESSKWIHRDKLARIESEELQAAGIILPKPRARSKPRREMSLDKVNGHRKAVDGEVQLEPRSRKNSAAVSEPRTPDISVPSWDLRLPEEIAEDPGSYFVPSSGGKGVSRIPVAKLSPVPIPIQHIERETPITRKRDDSPGAEDSITFPKTRSRSDSMKAALESSTTGMSSQPARRSATDVSPKKNAAAAGARKTSAPAKSSGPTGRPKTRNGASKDSTSSGGGQTRPSTRSGERELSPGAMSKQPEGEPPWMVSAYKPDPRLPPDQQMLPTVAKRLQQEKWEREGKFGNIYDKEFRPLTDEGFLKPPEATEKSVEPGPEKQEEWPLKTEAKSPTLGQGRTGSYTTIPKIQDKPPYVSPLPSPRGPIPQAHDTGSLRVTELQEEEETKKGCGCCIVM